MTDNKVRLSQVVGVYGPGAMLDLPDRSVLVMGLDHWDMKGKDTFKPIEEPRLQRLLYSRLRGEDDARLVGTVEAHVGVMASGSDGEFALRLLDDC